MKKICFSVVFCLWGSLLETPMAAVSFRLSQPVKGMAFVSSASLYPCFVDPVSSLSRALAIAAQGRERHTIEALRRAQQSTNLLASLVLPERFRETETSETSSQSLGCSAESMREEADRKLPRDSLALNNETVEAALNDIRPLLQTHGGSVRLVATDPQKRLVTLQLQGACVGCPSAAVTLKKGIEKSLREVWPGLEVIEAHREAEETEETDMETKETLETDRLRSALQGIFPAIEQMGGRLSISKTGMSLSSFQPTHQPLI